MRKLFITMLLFILVISGCAGFRDEQATEEQKKLSETKKEADREIEWLGFRRRAPQAKRESRPNQFYPIYVNIVIAV